LKDDEKKDTSDNSEAGDGENDKLMDQLRGAIVMDKPNVPWKNVAGLETAKRLLRDTTELPLEFPHLFQGKLKPWKGILLYGPPGTGKTYLAKAVATASSDESTFLSISSANLVSKFVGESARLVKSLFTLARQKAPSVVFIDEVDSLCSARGDGKSESSTQLLTEFLTRWMVAGQARREFWLSVLRIVPGTWIAPFDRGFKERSTFRYPTPRLARRCSRFSLVRSGPN